MLLMLYLVAITAEAMTGALSAGRRGMDWFGVVLIACVTALGGGSVRDVLLGHYPLTWVKHPEYLVLTTFAALVTIFIAPLMRHLRSLFLVLDALGLVAFTLIGCMTALEMGQGFLVASISGVITGVFGGILRDIFCNDIPLIFRRELYASVSLAVCLLYWLLSAWNVNHDLNIAVCFAGGLAFRLLAIRLKWRLPVFSYQERWE